MPPWLMREEHCAQDEKKSDRAEGSTTTGRLMVEFFRKWGFQINRHIHKARLLHPPSKKDWYPREQEIQTRHLDEIATPLGHKFTMELPI